jgi:hypothetical protein
VDDRAVFESKATWVAQMMDVDEGDQGLWNRDELEAMFRHQLAAPLEFDFGLLGPSSVRQLESLRSVEDPPIHSFADLLNHPRPPIELLKITKEFAKSCRSRSDCRLPDEIATMLYVLSILVAMTRCSQRISKLDDQYLDHMADWAREQSWIDDATRSLLRGGCRAVENEEPDADV